MYRVAWIARQEDGSLVTLHSPEYLYVGEASDDRDATARLAFVAEAWIEQAEWKRIS
jgi:hypothetical protein